MRQVSDQFPFMEVSWQVRGLSGSGLAFLDTGFDGFLMLPEDWLANLGDPDAIDWWRLADGSFIAAPVYKGFVSVTGVSNGIASKIVVMGDELIFGLQVFRRYLVTLERGQRVIVEP